MSKFTFGNFEAEFDPTDVIFVEKYEAAAQEYDKKIKEMPQGEKASDILKAAYAIFSEFFDSLFGKNASQTMFAGKQSLDLCTKAFKQLICIINDYEKTLKDIQPLIHTSSTQKSKK